MEGDVKEPPVRHTKLGELKIFEDDKKIESEIMASKLAGFLNTLIKITSRGNSLADERNLSSALFWILETKNMQEIQLLLNGHSFPNYTIEIAYPKDTVQGNGYIPIEERIESLRKSFENFDENTMERNKLEEYPVFRFIVGQDVDDKFPGFMYGLRRNEKNPRILEFEVKSLRPAMDE